MISYYVQQVAYGLPQIASQLLWLVSDGVAVWFQSHSGRGDGRR